ncbi:hypothetical protein [Streptosporangium roseum]|uniref:Uncharacterized protein n=1 Tax=Streptosporangium roseum (strain ATCC 12428 / DSM 43021 / JCM 3005 / KCTC 9067 / NCIMB 10171 / NRRL 2505 / NI 9100) TaxID=479432 RepID=D2AXX6_STRRD|nr:hypothetical protein [Streptosporangium roseum]ACZ85147.1 hypothetical protein Sros_2164 [Streptosporangium roseum DSM 43021]
MKRNLQRWGALGAAAVSLAGAMVVTGGTTAAHADVRCMVNTIYINASPGGDPKQQALGHSHNTGKHYVGSYQWYSTGWWLWEWYADNDGGSDGDTADTWYGSSWCDHAAW